MRSLNPLKKNGVFNRVAASAGENRGRVHRLLLPASTILFRWELDGVQTFKVSVGSLNHDVAVTSPF
jgi:hypothetical protein